MILISQILHEEVWSLARGRVCPSVNTPFLLKRSSGNRIKQLQWVILIRSNLRHQLSHSLKHFFSRQGSFSQTHTSVKVASPKCYIRINSLSNCINYRPNKTDKNNFIFLEKEKK